MVDLLRARVEFKHAWYYLTRTPLKSPAHQGLCFHKRSRMHLLRVFVGKEGHLYEYAFRLRRLFLILLV